MILIVVRNIFGVSGGVERMATNLANFYSRSNHRIAILSWNDDKEGECKYKLDERIRLFSLGISNEELSKKASISRRLIRLKKLKQIVQDIRPTHILCFQLGVMKPIICLKFYMSFKLTALERNSVQRYDYNSENKLVNNVLLFLFVNSVGIQAPSYVIHYPFLFRKKLRVLPNLHTFEESVFEVDKSNSNKSTVAIVGRNSYQKNSQNLLSLSKELEARGKLRIKIYGNSYQPSKLFPETTNFLYEGENKLWYHSNSDYCLLYSLWEGIPNVFIEAMYNGIVCVGPRNVYGIRDLLSFDRGILFENNNQVVDCLPVDSNERKKYRNSARDFVSVFSVQEACIFWFKLIVRK